MISADRMGDNPRLQRAKSLDGRDKDEPSMIDERPKRWILDVAGNGLFWLLWGVMVVEG